MEILLKSWSNIFEKKINWIDKLKENLWFLKKHKTKIEITTEISLI